MVGGDRFFGRESSLMVALRREKEGAIIPGALENGGGKTTCFETKIMDGKGRYSQNRDVPDSTVAD